MKKLFLLFLWGNMVSSMLFGQVDTIFFDSFDDNSHNWTILANRKRTAAISEGAYQISAKSKEAPLFLARTVLLDSFPDYKIETAITQMSGAKNMGYGLSWGARKDRQDFYAILVSSNRQYTILKVSRGRYKQIKRWTKTKLVKGPKKPNTLAMMKKGDLLYYYINDMQVFTSKFEPSRGNQIGILLHGTMKLDADYLAVTKPAPPAPIPVDSTLMRVNTDSLAAPTVKNQ